MKNIKRKYKGFSLIEMLLTVMILTVVMLLVATTLNTVIKVSHSTNSKNIARSDINYIMDLMSRSISSSELSDIYLFNSLSVRKLGEYGNPRQLSVLDISPGEIPEVYGDGSLGASDKIGNEIHIKLYGYQTWTCFGYFKWDENSQYGFIVKAVSFDDLEEIGHETCFGSGIPVVPLHSFVVDVSDFQIQYYNVGDDVNRKFLINATLDPLYWPVSDTFPVTSEVSRQVVISTQALTWY